MWDFECIVFLYKKCYSLSHQPTFIYTQSIKNLNFNIKFLFFFFGV